MSTMDRAVRSALVVIAGLLAASGASSTAVAQRSHAGRGQTAQRGHPQGTGPYPGASVTIDPSWIGGQRFPSQRRRQPRSAPVVYYIVPGGYSYDYRAGYGGGVYDTNGRPLSTSYDWRPMSQYPIGTPDLSGSPYEVVEGGAMLVDFGDDHRRTVTSCAALASEGTPDGQPRTIFYQPPADGVVLRVGERGRVRGTPAGGAPVCYALDAYGRMELRY